MSRYDYIERLYNIYKDIANRRKGTPAECAARYRVCRKTFYNILEELKIRGAEIKFSRINNCFYFKNDFEIVIKTFSKKNLLNEKKYKNCTKITNFLYLCTF